LSRQIGVGMKTLAEVLSALRERQGRLSSGVFCFL
jgi:hypothetical protein